jgi:photosystem II stability/assembly factor-like uncharacterized protein
MSFITKTLILLFFSLQVFAQQWKQQNVMTDANFRTVYTLSETEAWASGTKGTVIKTIDGGQTWTVMQVPSAEGLDFRDIHVFDSNTAIVLSAGEAEKGQAMMYRTTDGGQTWDVVYDTDQKGVFLDGFDFWDKDRGLAFGDPIDGKFFLLSTRNGGLTWEKESTENIPPSLEGEAAFAASGTSISIFGKKGICIATGGSHTARVFRSFNRGKTWAAVSTPMPASKSSGLFGLRFRDELYGMAVGGDYLKTSADGNNVLITQNGGRTWIEATATQPKGLKEAIVFVGTTAVVVGPSGTSMSKDFGQNWVQIGLESLHSASAWGQSIYAVGAKGLVLKMTLSQ